jgi:hypothetical protein
MAGVSLTEGYIGWYCLRHTYGNHLDRGRKNAAGGSPIWSVSPRPRWNLPSFDYRTVMTAMLCASLGVASTVHQFVSHEEAWAYRKRK